MNVSLALRRTRSRRRSAAYTLIELMVVVVLIAILAMAGAPSFVKARSDRLAFSYARQVGEIVHNARARSAARGSAHMVVYDGTTYGARGALFSFEALDNTDASATPPGPNPAPSCKTPGQWQGVQGYTAGTATNLFGLIDGLNINPTSTAAIEVVENITMIAYPTPSTTAMKAFVLCTTPNGTTFYGTGSTVDDAVTAMQASIPFTGIVEIDVARHDSGGTIVGLNRRVLITGGAAPRIKSE